MEGTASSSEDDGDFEHLDGSPGIFIPCEDLEALQELIYTLYDEEILDGETSFILKNVPDNILEILNDPDYFDSVEVCGIRLKKGSLKLLEKSNDDLL